MLLIVLMGPDYDFVAEILVPVLRSLLLPYLTHIPLDLALVARQCGRYP